MPSRKANSFTIDQPNFQFYGNKNSLQCSQHPILEQIGPVQFITVFSTSCPWPDRSSPIHYRVFNSLSLNSTIQFITTFSTSYAKPDQFSPVQHSVLNTVSLTRSFQSSSSPCSQSAILNHNSPVQFITLFSNCYP